MDRTEDNTQITITRRKWTKEEIEKLKELAPTGIGSKKIGGILGRTEKAILYEAFKLGIKIKRHSPPPSWSSMTKDEEEKMWELWGKGYSITQISKKLGRSENTIRRKMEE